MERNREEYEREREREKHFSVSLLLKCMKQPITVIAYVESGAQIWLYHIVAGTHVCTWSPLYLRTHIGRIVDSEARLKRSPCYSRKWGGYPTNSLTAVPSADPDIKLLDQWINHHVKNISALVSTLLINKLQ